MFCWSILNVYVFIFFGTKLSNKTQLKLYVDVISVVAIHGAAVGWAVALEVVLAESIYLYF